MEFNILAINPGSTSTKVALYRDETQLLDLTLHHTTEQVAPFPVIIDQLEWRLKLILDELEHRGIDIRTLSAVIGRCGLVKPIEAGVYEVDEALRHDLIHAKLEHASNLGGLIADEIARMVGIKAYVADPVVVDEMEDVARISGLPECPRVSIFHALNQKATARRYARQIGTTYEALNLVVAHIGGGISVGAHRKGRVVDTNNAFNGDGPFAPERMGSVPSQALIDLCFSGKYTYAELVKKVAGRGGLVAHAGTNSVIQLAERIEQGDEQARLLLDAMCYNIAKWIGAMATAALRGEVDAILLTGGIANNAQVTGKIAEYCSFIAPVKVFPGENEMESLRYNASMVLRGEVEAKLYRPVTH